MFKLFDFFPKEKGKLIMIAVILSIAIVYQFIITLIILTHANIFILFCEMIVLFFVLYRIIWFD